jgi:hypothetical protein
MITGWAFTSQYAQIHYFDQTTGTPICSQAIRNPKKKRKSKATIPLKDWNPENPSTCPVCRKLYRVIREEEIGRIGGIQRIQEIEIKSENKI